MYDALVTRPKRKTPLILLMVGVLLVLLPLLAYLQYQWQGQVSEGLRGQMQSQMRRAAAQFSEDFDREIRRVHASFQSGPIAAGSREDRERQIAQNYATLFQKWNQTAPYPSLVSDIYLVPQSNGEPDRIEKLNPSTAKFEEIDWPVDLMGWRKPNVSIIRMDHADERMIQFSSKSIDRKIPALIISIADSGTFRHPDADPLPVRVPAAQVIVKLNLQYLQQELFPALARQHMSTPDGTTSYNVAVVDRTEPRRVIYSSKAGQDIGTKFDVSEDIFTSSSVLEFPVIGAPTIAFATRDVIGRGKVVTGSSIFSIRTKDTAAGPFVAALPTDQPWQIVLTHQLGSVEAAVIQARNKNLAINFGILLLLAASVAFILLSVQRERRLAQQQMEFVSAVSHELKT